MASNPPASKGTGFSTARSLLTTDRLGWALMVSVLILCAAMMGAAWWYYRSNSQDRINLANRNVLAVTVTRSLQLENWRRQQLGNGRMLMSSHGARAAERILAGRETHGDREEITGVMAVMTREFQYADIALVTAEGKVKTRFNQPSQSEDAYRKSSRMAGVQAALRAHDAVFTDLAHDTRDGKPRMALVAPVGDAGAMILEIDPTRFLYPYLESWPGYSRTAESLLIRVDGDQIVYLNSSRRQPGITPFFHRTLKFRLPPASVLDSGVVSSGPDYRGHRVYAALRHLHDSPWYINSKIDAEEVDLPNRQLARETGILMAFIGLAGLSMVGLIWVRHRGNLYREKEEWFRAAANESPVYLWMMSPRGQVTFLNTPLQRYLGVGADFIHYWQWKDSFHPDDISRVEGAIRVSVEERQGHTGEYRVRRFDGEYRVIVSESLPRLGPDRKLLGFAGALTDITERKEAETRSEVAAIQLRREVTEHARTAQEVRLLSARLMTAREDERKHLAAELHDDLNQQIAAVSIGMGNLKRQIEISPRQASHQTDLIQREIVRISETVYRISHELHPAALEYNGIIPTLRSACEKFSLLTSIRVSLLAPVNFQNPEESISMTIYRIVQEGLQNIAKHAGTSTAVVRIECLPELLQLVISDAGVGMPATQDRRQGIGLVSIRERVGLVGGSLQIESAPGKGTDLIVRIPVRKT